VFPYVVDLAAPVADDALSVAEWAGILGAAAASVAAVAALVTVLQNSRMIRASLRPHLYGVVVGQQERPILEIHNAGGGVATVVQCVFVGGTGYAAMDVSGAIASGDYQVVVAALPAHDPADSHGVVMCRDAHGNHYAWSLDGHAAMWKKRMWRKTLTPRKPLAVYRQLYGSNSLDGVHKVSWRLARKESSALVMEPFLDGD
jgi:hypothetical protein